MTILLLNNKIMNFNEDEDAENQRLKVLVRQTKTRRSIYHHPAKGEHAGIIYGFEYTIYDH